MINLILIIVTVGISISAFYNENLFRNLSFNAYAVAHQRQYHKLFTYGFIHANGMHLFVNMFVLWMFGKHLEASYVYLFNQKGHAIYLLLYVSSIVVSTMYDLKKHKDNYYYNAVGASGATSAIVFAYILLYPTQKLYLFFIPIGIPAFFFAALFLIYSAYMAKKKMDNIGHTAHFMGAIYGFLFILIFNYKLIIHFVIQIVDFLT